MKEVKQRFELDYWGLSYRKALEFIVKTDPSPVIHIYAENPPGRANATILPAADGTRLVFVPTVSEADYFVADFRHHKDDYGFKTEVYSLSIGNAKVMVAYKL